MRYFDRVSITYLRCVIPFGIFTRLTNHETENVAAAGSQTYPFFMTSHTVVFFDTLIKSVIFKQHSNYTNFATAYISGQGVIGNFLLLGLT